MTDANDPIVRVEVTTDRGVRTLIKARQSQADKIRAAYAGKAEPAAKADEDADADAATKQRTASKNK